MDSPQSRTLPDLLDEITARYPNREAIVWRDDRLTYEAYRSRVRHLAKGLYRLGVCAGDKVALLMENRTEWLLSDFAVTLLGATLVPVSTWSRARELAYVLQHSHATTLIMVDRFRHQDFIAMLAEIGALRGQLPLLRQIICVGHERYPGITRFEELWELGAAVSDAELDILQRAVEPTDTPYLLYTSGTTSTPKGVPLQHFGLIENMFHIGERQHLSEADRLWMGLSLFWGFGCENALFAVMTHGGTVVLQDHFDAGETLRIIERERCTIYYGTPNVTLALWEHPDRRRVDLSSLRTGAAIGSPQAMQMVMDLGVHEICNVYGLTECYGNCTVTEAWDPVEVRLHTVGHPLPGMQIKIADPQTHQPLPPGTVGEIAIRGYLMPGYYQAPEQNATAFDPDGYFLSGDFGFLDEEGRLHFRGRLKDMVKTGGINVAPLEVEEFLATHPAVEQAYVVGVPDPRKEEVIAAVVVCKSGSAVTEDELCTFCRKGLAAFKVPQHVWFVTRDMLPLTASGKVQKHLLRSMLVTQAAQGDAGGSVLVHP